jgi:hypothetical protein
MIQQNWDAQNGRFCLFITITSNPNENREFRVVASDSGKTNSKYADRIITVQGERSIYLSFPVSPKQLTITIMDKAKPLATDFEVVFRETKLRNNMLVMDDDTRSFVQMGVVVSQTLGFAPPQAYKSSDGLYTIVVHDVIKDAQGNAMSTPARIGHTTGRIELSKSKMDGYTIPMRMIILLHEFSHKYKNPKMGLAIENEVGADINALYIYLSLGFSKIDCIYVFANVFLSAKTDENIKRMRIIMDYIQKFQNKQNLI